MSIERLPLPSSVGTDPIMEVKTVYRPAVDHVPCSNGSAAAQSDWTVPGFELLEELNRGGMGVVYKARQIALNRIVAVKVIAPAALAVPLVRERFAREVRATARLNHPNIVTVFHTDLDGPVPYLAMEYVSGIDLLRLVEKVGPLPLADALSCIRQAAEGLRYTHGQGLIHRDIKPSNLILSTGPGDAVPQDAWGRLKILDLGLARSLLGSKDDSEGGLTDVGVFLGTPDYVSPEQAEDSRRADVRSDIFSLGGVLYFLLTGEVPFPGKSLVEKVRKTLTVPVPSLAARRSDVSPDLDKVLRRMLAFNPADRFQNMSEVLNAIELVSLGIDQTNRADNRFPSHITSEARDLRNSTMPSDYFHRERSTLILLSGAIRRRADSESEIASAFQAACDKAEREIARSRKANTAAREKELDDVDAIHQKTTRELHDRFEADKYTLNRDRDERRAVLLDKFRVAEERARTEYQDRLWTIDSVLEGGQKKAQDQLDSLQRTAAAGQEEVGSIWETAAVPLARTGLKRDDIEYFGAIELEPTADPVGGMQDAIAESGTVLATLQSLLLPRLHGFAGLLLCILLAAGIGAAAFAFTDVETAATITATSGVVLGTALWLVLRSAARRKARRIGSDLGKKQTLAEAACSRLQDFATAEHRAEIARITEKHARKRKETRDYYEPLLEQQRQSLDSEIERLVSEHDAGMNALASRWKEESRAEDEGYRTHREEIEKRYGDELEGFEQRFADRLAAATTERDTAWEKMAADWGSAIAEVAATVSHLRGEGERVFPSWGAIDRDDRPLPDQVAEGIRYGSLSIDPPSIPDAVSADSRLALPDDLAGPMPAFLPFPDRCSLVLKVRDDGRAAAVNALQAVMLRFLTGLPPGKVRFTIIDPVGLGENFAAFMHLADLDEKLVTGQIWTEPRAIEGKLIDLTDHIASVHQKYLRNQYRSIEEYNRAAGEVAEAYRVLVVANFPEAFTPEAAKRLLSIASSGPSCGVCALVSVDTKAAMPREFTLADLEGVSIVLGRRDGRFTPRDEAFASFPLDLDSPPEPAAIARIAQRVGKASVESVRVEVPFEYIAPKPEEIWTASAAKGFDVPVGRAGATRRQIFSLGRGTAQHALIAGKTGSGKSTLLHALITNLALTYSPDEAELYLIDFKEGVEFQWYATYRLPHARVVAIQSEREFGLSVLQRLDGILRERGERFREAAVNDLASYRAERPNEKTPRILLVVDEFQQFFVEDDKLAQEAALLLDRLVRQGRAFGLHVLLGSQTLGGAYSLARSTIDQMAVRVALQCSDADAQLILSKDNTAARLLSRPGEAIYNDQNGLVEGNDPFQVVWLSDENREDLLRTLGERAAGQYPPPLVFEGNTVADISKNPALARVLESPLAETKVPIAWLGDPVAIKEPTAAAFRAQGAANLLLIGQNEEAAHGLFAAAVLALAAQLRPILPSPLWGEGGEGRSPEPGEGEGAPPFTLLDGTPDDADDAEYLRRLAERLPHRTAIPDRAQLPAAIGELAAELDRRQKGETADRSPRFLLVFGVQRYRELRKSEDDFGFGRRGGDREPSPAERFAAILRDGPPLGVHVITWCDTLTNLNRTFDRVLLREFGLRVLFQMSPTDSSTLMDSPAASRLGRTRALFLREEQERPEKFRPYGLPPTEWLDNVIASVQHRVGLKEPAAGV